MTPQVYIGEGLASYGFGEGHPFGSDRLNAFWHEAVRRGLDKRVHIAEPATCGESELLRFHSRAYVERVKTLSRSGTGFLDSGDTPAVKGMFEAASCVVGSGLDGLVHCIGGEHPPIWAWRGVPYWSRCWKSDSGYANF